MGQKISRLILFTLDLFISLILAVVILILLTGGTFFYFRETLIRLQSVENPITVAYFLTILRLLLNRKVPFLGFISFSFERIVKRCRVICKKLYFAISSLRPSRIMRIVIIIIGISLVIKVFNAAYFYGFFSGDDVEVQEMTFGHLFHWANKAWNLRSPFYPMVFIFPIQATLKALGVQDPFYLIFAGRMVVVLFSSLNLYLVFLIASRLFKSRNIGLVCVFFFALNKLHTTLGSSVLPRTIASTFILVSFWLLLNETKPAFFALLSGGALAVGASIRFGEIAFIVPAFLFLVFNKRIKNVIFLVLSFLMMFVLINGLSDQLYWGQPFFSLKNVIDYTLVRQESTRGFQPYLYYLLAVGLWSDYFSLGFVLLSLRRNRHKIWVWVAAPLLILSFFPHKEPRYLLPILPFFCILAGLSAWTLLENIYHDKWRLVIQRKIVKPVLPLAIILGGVIFLAHKDYRLSYLVLLLSGIIGLILLAQRWRGKKIETAPPFGKVISLHTPALLVFALVGAVVFEVNGFFFRRSESGVDMARYLYNQADKNGVAIEDIWRAGGMLYLWQKPTLMNIDNFSFRDKNSFALRLIENSIGWVGIRESSIKRYDLSPFLHDQGFTEVQFSVRARLNPYRLFKKGGVHSRTYSMSPSQQGKSFLNPRVLKLSKFRKE